MSAGLSVPGRLCSGPVNGQCAAAIKPGRHPVIVFLHGCGGPRDPEPLLDLGAIVVEPDSFAGGLRCTMNRKSLVQLLKARHADIAYAAGQLKAAAWADPDKLILAGFSNGAQAAATYPGGEFMARIIIAWTCNNPHAPDQNGVRGMGPVLALLGTADEHYRRIGFTGDCGAAVAERPDPSRSIRIPGGGHEIFTHPTTRKALAAFVPAVIR